MNLRTLLLGTCSAALLCGIANAETLTIATVNNGDMVRMQGLMDDFYAKHPDIKVEWVTLEENVLRAPIDADIGAILGWGYPPFRGGPLGTLHSLGIKQAVADCDRLATANGPRFATPKRLREMAEKGEKFFPV